MQSNTPKHQTNSQNRLAAIYPKFRAAEVELDDLSVCEGADFNHLVADLGIPVTLKLRLKSALKKLREGGAPIAKGGGGGGMMILSEKDKDALARVGQLMAQVKELLGAIPTKLKGHWVSCFHRMECTLPCHSTYYEDVLVVVVAGQPSVVHCWRGVAHERTQLNTPDYPSLNHAQTTKSTSQLPRPKPRLSSKTSAPQSQPESTWFCMK